MAVTAAGPTSNRRAAPDGTKHVEKQHWPEALSRAETLIRKAGLVDDNGFVRKEDVDAIVRKLVPQSSAPTIEAALGTTANGKVSLKAFLDFIWPDAGPTLQKADQHNQQKQFTDDTEVESPSLAHIQDALRGSWTTNGGQKVEISGRTIQWEHGPASHVDIVASSGELKLHLYGTMYTAQLCDRKLLWDDGDVWIKACVASMQNAEIGSTVTRPPPPPPPPVKATASSEPSSPGRGPQLLGSHGYNKAFDDHFKVTSAYLHDALHKGYTKSERCEGGRCVCFPKYKSMPQAWGIKVRLIWLLWEYVAEDLTGYAAAHDIGDGREHVCLAEPCAWDHMGVRSVPLSEYNGPRRRLKPTMHLLVARYIKPFTQDHEGHGGAGFALHLNAAKVVTVKGLSPDEWCFPSIFISHSWSEAFVDFAATLSGTLDPDCVVWVCSFAIWQLGDIAASLSEVETCPFAIAMNHSQRVVAVTDRTAEAFERCWVIFEAEIARKWEKPYDISLPDNADVEVWNVVGSKLAALDVRQCKASREDDKKAILEYASHGDRGIDGLNETVRSIAEEAMRRAKLMAAVANGDTESIQERNKQELIEWSSIRGRSTTHIAAANSRIAAMLDILERTGSKHLNMPDKDGHTPLNVAIQSGSLASVEALICFRADVHNLDKNNLSPLHWAAARGHSKMCRRLLNAKCKIEAAGTFEGREGMTPLLVAADQGKADVIAQLIESRANVQARCTTGFSPLHIAAFGGFADAAVALIQMRAEVDGRDDEKQRTPLMFACSFGRVTVVTVLLGAAASVEAVSTDGKTVFKYCDKCTTDDAQIIRMFLQKKRWSEKIIRYMGFKPCSGGTLAADTAKIVDTIISVCSNCETESGETRVAVLARLLQTIDPDTFSRSKMEEMIASAKAAGKLNGFVDYKRFFQWVFRFEEPANQDCTARAPDIPPMKPLRNHVPKNDEANLAHAKELLSVSHTTIEEMPLP